MHPRFFTLTALLALAGVHAVPAGQPSGVPTCTFICPPQDLGGFTLGSHSDNGVSLFCSYPHIPNENASNHHCDYFDNTGLLKTDQDDGLCPPVAVPFCTTRRRRNALPQAPALARVARAPTPDEMKVRAQLKKRRPVQVEA